MACQLSPWPPRMHTPSRRPVKKEKSEIQSTSRIGHCSDLIQLLRQ